MGPNADNSPGNRYPSRRRPDDVGADRRGAGGWPYEETGRPYEETGRYDETGRYEEISGGDDGPYEQVDERLDESDDPARPWVAPRHRAPGRGLPTRLSRTPPRLRRRRRLMAAFAILIIVCGSGVLGGAYFFDAVKTSDQLTFPATTTVYYADGTPLAKLGEVTRYELAYYEMKNDAVLKTVVALAGRRSGPTTASTSASCAPRGTTSPAATCRADRRS